jgi:hypothetical protein
MPHQNRVTPFGEIITTPARGAWTGNRGCLHDAQGRIRRAYKTTRWIICLLEFKGVRRQIMAPGLWTELFFLDEATALAAGHRPCAYCQRPRFELFRTLWAAANPTLAAGPKPSAPQIDAVLHRERITASGQKITYLSKLELLPAGVLVTTHEAQQTYLWWGGRLWPWSPAGYGNAAERAGDSMVQVLTPRSVASVLAHGYPVQVHPTAN